MQPNCIHYWIVGSPQGPICKGVCKKCGEKKDFIGEIEFWDKLSAMSKEKEIKLYGK